jgi:hypothetical protein
LFWLVLIDPVAWEALRDAGLLIHLRRTNDRPESARAIGLGTHEGPGC